MAGNMYAINSNGQNHVRGRGPPSILSAVLIPPLYTELKFNVLNARGSYKPFQKRFATVLKYRLPLSCRN